MAQKIPVTRDGKRGSDFFMLDASDIVRIDQGRDQQYIVHTKDNLYYLSISFDSLEEMLFEAGFRMIDSGNLVNMNQIEQYDRTKGIVFLGNPHDRKTKTASVARIHKNHIENVLKMLSAANEQHETLDQRTDEILNSFIAQNEDERFLRSYATIHAVNEKRRAEQKIAHMAYHDSLTGLPNRTMFHDKLNQHFAHCEKTGKKMAVLFFDLDRFKIINDTLGHYMGDELLKQLSTRLSSIVQSKDLFARFGGDEFIVLLSDINHVDEVNAFCQSIHAILRESFLVGGQELFVSASIGVSIYPADGSSAEALVKHADTAMYRAKEKGGNTHQFYHSEMNLRSMERLNLENHLRKALEKDEILLYYQPLVDLHTGETFGMESLVRWKHPKYGMVSPGEFIPLAEETGLIVPIGNWVLREACRQNAQWLRNGLPPLCVSVNISMNQFHQPGFVQIVEDALLETKLPPHLLCLEITESVAMKNVSFITEAMSRLKQLGVRISIDDFGTGYSSLSYLKRFRVHTLKIDQSFIRDVTDDEDNAAIVTALIAMSQQLKMKSLAEGVETMEQLEFLKRSGCDEIQGYIFSHPLPAEDFEHFLKSHITLYH
ncbi:EAL domain-containing protein [Paenibacillus turpanensis]|uniref:EAL domain-containing protein n=1 Tax=Paenibacillus turpanensis TaxID=2689078 RepID=UPI001FB710EC|nr:EAL domain-containing protein [Paenibacillus turpanensis]